MEMARVLISMPERFLDEIDAVAEGENRSRSELIREALRTYMYRNQVRNSQKAANNAEILESLLG
jgi:metal-responsive CopG/Arc/MetJ family transcriptional regulator